MELECLQCGVRMAHWDERRHAVPPVAALCSTCSHPAWRKPGAWRGP
ncbi:MAG TPA: hypothetical protein VM889_02845 [Candidatus Thermoplasmatota archaeon]|nr:hypothetical protein [Candidatus Thermoplasmatota archaeon]